MDLDANQVPAVQKHAIARPQTLEFLLAMMQVPMTQKHMQVLLSEEFLCASDGRNSNLGFTISQARVILGDLRIRSHRVRADRLAFGVRLLEGRRSMGDLRAEARDGTTRALQLLHLWRAS